MQSIRLLTIFLLVFFINHLSAQWEWQNAAFSNLDLGYELNGFITLDNQEKGDGVIQMIVQPDGKTLILGYSSDTSNINQEHVLIRLNTDGNLDTSFGEAGMVKLPQYYHAAHMYDGYQGLALQSDNKIVIVGEMGEWQQTDGIILRYTTNGLLDPSFGNEGITTLITENSISNFKVGIQANDKIIVAASTNSDLILIRFEKDGFVDTTFGEEGKVIIGFSEKEETPAKILLQKDQKIIVIGRTNIYAGQKGEFALARFLPTGDLDEAFGQEGKVTTVIGYGEEAYPADGALQADGKIIVMGSAMGQYQPDYAMVRYLPNGQLDNTFGNRGKTITNVSPYGDRGSAMLLQPDGKILVVGNSQEWSSHITLIRYNTNGKLDYDFGDRGKQRPYLSLHGSRVASIALQDNKVILAGNLRLESRPNSDFLLIRFLSDFRVGTVNFQTKTNNALVYPNPIQTEATLEYTLENPETLTIQLTDLTGRILKTYLQKEPQKAGDYQQEIDLPNDLPKGFYYIRLVAENGHHVVKVVK